MKPYEYNICRQTFGRKNLRDRHEQNVHHSGRPILLRASSEGNTSVSNESKNPRMSDRSILGPDVLSACLDLYFICFAPTTPVIHQATFNATRRYTGLIRTMAAIGASYSDDQRLRAIGIQIYKEEWTSMRQVFASIHVEGPRAFDMLLEVLLLKMFCLAYLDQSQCPDCRSLLLDSIHFTWLFGIGRPLQSGAPLPPEDLHGRWIEWVKYETFKRMSLLFYVVDGIVASLFTSQAHMTFAEVKHNMPVDEVIWRANTLEQWQAACISTSANTETPASFALFGLLNFRQIPSNLNELSSVLLSTFLFTTICQQTLWKLFYPTLTAPCSARPDRSNHGNDTETWIAREISSAQDNIKFAIDALLDRTREQKRNSSSSSPLWDTSSIIQQLAYLRLYLPSPPARHAVSTSVLDMAMCDIVDEIIKEDLGDVEYRLITLLLNWFIELILSQIHLQFQGNLGVNRRATESSINCSILIHSMLEIWRLVRYTNLNAVSISQSPELSLARLSFISTVKELCSNFVEWNDSNTVYISEALVAEVLRCVCRDMFSATG